MIVGFTVRQSILLSERIQIEWLVALDTGETFRMPSFAQRRDNFVCDGLLASKALGQEEFVEMIPAVWLAIVFSEIARIQNLVASGMRTNKTMRVPLFAQSNDWPLFDWFGARTTFG